VSVDYLLGKTDDPTPIKRDSEKDESKLDLKQIKQALLEKELVYDKYEFTQEEQEDIRAILLAVIEREERKKKQ
jgi:hypothetical protein